MYPVRIYLHQRTDRLGSKTPNAYRIFVYTPASRREANELEKSFKYHQSGCIDIKWEGQQSKG